MGLPQQKFLSFFQKILTKMYNYDIITSQGKVQISTEVRKSLGPSGPFFLPLFSKKII